MSFGVIPNGVWDVGTLDWVRMTQPGGVGGGGASTIADGADVAEGATTDAAVVTDAAGTVSGKLRGLVKWAFERMPASLGQKTMAASLPVALASNQSALAVDTEMPAAALLNDFAIPTTPSLGAFPYIYNVASGTWYRARDAESYANGVFLGSGVPTAGIIAQWNDTVPFSAVSDRDFGMLRMTQRRGLHTSIRDGAGNERGANVAAPSTLPVATDTALVVTQRDALPAGANVIGAVLGTKTGNAAAPGATNVGTLPATATAASPAYTEGNQVALSTDLSGSGRVATASNTNPIYAEAAGSPMSQTLDGHVRMTEKTAQMTQHLLESMLVELRTQNAILHATLNCRDDIDLLRRDSSSLTSASN